MPISDASRRRTLRGRFDDWVRASAAESEAGLPFVLRCAWRTVRLFLKNRGPSRASALAYTTLLALVPLLAISLSVSALFLPRNETERREQLLAWMEFGVARAAPALGLSDEDGRTQRTLVADKIVSFVERIHFKTLGAAATFGLLLVVIGLLRTVETTFNDIWGVPTARPLGLSIVFYWAAITLGPLLLIATQIAVYLPWLARASGGIQQLLP
ncbi:MAG: YihY/virulence factor BrkB family protein, partial [Verrucomicrobiae bacterium]|nr:YihY/virulence factor BrkB family protein [Verrucomicrobiae bacterium]